MSGSGCGKRCLALGAIVALAACQYTPERRPQLLAPEAFQTEIRGLCLEEVSAGALLGAAEDAAPRLARVRNLLVSAITAHGYAVVPPPAAEERWQRALREEEGIYDRHEGHVLPAAYRRARSRYFVWLREELGCQALVSARLVAVSAPLVGGKATWDSTSQGLGVTANGRVAALSLWIGIEGPGEEELYFGAGGVEVLQRIEHIFPSPMRLVPRDPDSLLRSDQRLIGAIRAALADLPRLFEPPAPQPDPGSPGPTPSHDSVGGARPRPSASPRGRTSRRRRGGSGSPRCPR